MAKPRPIDPWGVAGEVSAFPNVDPAAVDADESTIQVNQCSSGIARIDWRVGLDRLVCHYAVIGTDTWAYRTVQGADDAFGDGARQPKWRSHRHYRLTDA